MRSASPRRPATATTPAGRMSFSARPSITTATSTGTRSSTAARRGSTRPRSGRWSRRPVRVQTFIPTQVVFDGMPNTRWWAFEDRRTNFGEVAPDTTDVGKLMLMEFALIFANDWFVVPWTLPVGGLARVQGIALSTVFDERLWIEPVTQGVADEGWESWSMFSLTGDSAGHSTFPSELAILPVAPKVLEGESLEDLSLVRDEMANMVWAIEHQVPLPTGWPRSGHEAAHELRTFLQGLVGPPAGPPPEPAAPIRYTAMTSVPEEWIPFIPVHVPGSTRETQLQRAAMPRFLDNAPPPPEPVRAAHAAAATELPGRVLRPRGRGAARGRPGHAVLPARSSLGRHGSRLVRRSQGHRAR